MAHNLSREVQMLAALSAAMALPKRPSCRAFERLDTLRHRLRHRDGQLIRPKGELTLSMKANEAVRKDPLHCVDVLREAA